MKVLIACEFSGIVREAFKKREHDAWSCDLQETEIPGQHIRRDVLEILGDGWDLMIAHPPCTYLSRVANRVWNAPGREEKRREAMKFFMELVNAPIEKICVENPVGVPNTEYRKPDQIIQPFFWGEPERKRTCLWLKNLRRLTYSVEDTLFWRKTTIEVNPERIDKRGHKIWFTENCGGSREGKARNRSRTFKAIAEAMAEQWGVENESKRYH